MEQVYFDLERWIF